MLYHFPDLDTLRLAITSGVVPQEVSLAPATAGIDDQGHIWLQPSVVLAKKAITGLRRLNVEAVEATGDLRAEEVLCWLQLLPVERDAAAPPLSNQAPVLFDLSDPGQLPGLVGEVLRLGNDRQSFRWLKEGRNERVLLRVIGPPYYSLLRALDRDGQKTAPHAYIERAPRVWVEVGHTHPLVENLKPAKGQLLLMRPEREWTVLEDGQFQDIYEILEFTLPGTQIGWKPKEPGKRLTVPLRLAPGSQTDPAELWVLAGEKAFEQVDTLVRDADDHLLSRLSFAIGERDQQQIIVLRVRPSKLAPPVVVLPGAECFRPFLKLPNLFLPCGTRLQPPLRRDAVRDLLADDPDQVIWLFPQPGDGIFQPESLPDESFRPLQDWVDYVLDHDRQMIQSWIAAASFDFESYICKDDGGGEPKPSRARNPLRERKLSDVEELEEDVPTAIPLKVTEKKKKSKLEVDEADYELPTAQPSELQQRRIELEQQFVAFDGPLDAPERQQIWPELASVNAALGQTADAAICWLNAMWEAEAPAPEWTLLWARTDAKIADRQVSLADLDRLLALENPMASDMRALSACIIHAAFGDRGSGRSRASTGGPVGQRLPQIQRFLEKHEGRLGTRAVWLTWLSLVKFSGGDVLALARTRDRLLERLLDGGLSVEYDLPSFLRFSGEQSSDRFRAVRDRVSRLNSVAQRWIELSNSRGISQTKECQGGTEATPAYKDLMFAFALARLGEANECRRLMKSATEALGNRDEVHEFLLNAFAYRIERALESKPHGGPLPPEQMEYLKLQMGNDRFKLFKVDRLRESSWILEPQEKIDAYRTWRAHSDDLGKELVALFGITDRQELAGKINTLLKDNQKKAKPLQRVMAGALQLATRVGETFTADLLAQTVAAQKNFPPVMDLHELEQRAKLLERGIFLAGHYDRAEHLQQLVSDFLQLLESQRANATQAMDTLAGQCLRSLRKLGLRHEIDSLLERMADLIVQGHDLPGLRKQQGPNWPISLRSLLQIAAGWLYFGRIEQALPVLDEARSLLFSETDMLPVYRTRLACAYAGALGQAPVELALQRLEEMFRRLVRIADTFTTNSHYALFQLQVVEAVVQAVVNDDFAMGQNIRRWLDEDEYLVRRRIHRDLRAFMAQADL